MKQWKAITAIINKLRSDPRSSRSIPNMDSLFGNPPRASILTALDTVRPAGMQPNKPTSGSRHHKNPRQLFVPHLHSVISFTLSTSWASFS